MPEQLVCIPERINKKQLLKTVGFQPGKPENQAIKKAFRNNSGRLSMLTFSSEKDSVFYSTISLRTVVAPSLVTFSR